MHEVAIGDLRGCLKRAFSALDAEDADGLAGLLVDSELRGHRDHGIAALGPLTAMYGDGRLNPRPDVRVVSETDGALLLDGDRGCGPAAPERAMAWCVDRARARGGMAVAAVRDWQCLIAAPWARAAAEAGLVGFACTNWVPLVAPPGGRTPALGTNPLAYGLPGDPPVVLDVATTTVSMQKVRVAANAGAELPDGLIFDAAGVPSTDPAALFDGGSLAPLGSPHAPHKGFGLALFVEALAGSLSGSGTTGTFMWALDVSAFVGPDDFAARIEALAARIRGGERAPGVDELVVPGERGERRLRELVERGRVPLDDAGWALLVSGLDALGVDAP